MKLTLFTNTQMKITRIALLAGALVATASCEDFLDVNNNPNGPELVTANLYLPPMVHWMVADGQWEGRFLGRYVQNWYQPGTSFTNWDRHGFDPGNDNGGQHWRDVYWSFGQNLEDMKMKAEAEQRWDLLGVGMILKGWGWMQLAALHGDIIVKQAIDQTRFMFDYDTEEYALQEAGKLLDSAIVLLKRTDGAVDATYLGRTDKVYGGDRTKWLKTAYGFKALLLNRYTNKGTYNAAAVIGAVDSSYTGNADDFLLPYPGTSTDNADKNFFGPTRGNVNSYRQTKFVLELMDGTQFGGTVDPRMSRMLAPSPDGAYRGLDINVLNYGALTTNQRPNNFFGYTGTPAAGSPSRYLFADKSKFPAITYAQLQFVKAEAAFRSGDRATALTAYTNGVSAHFDWVNARNADDGQLVTPISAGEKSAYLADPNVVPTAANLTMTHIMSQKYIAQWAWGFVEQWMDLRRFHYTDTYSGEARQAFPGFTLPTTFYSLNGGQPAHRLRPRYNSEYVWNRDALSKILPISGLADNYQTSELWITKP
jgi:hypothetical protein